MGVQLIFRSGIQTSLFPNLRVVSLLAGRTKWVLARWPIFRNLTTGDSNMAIG